MRKTRRVHVGAKVFLVLFAIYAAFTVVTLRFKISAKQAEMEDLRRRIELQRMENTRISDVLSSDVDMEYIARIARDRLGYITPGQRVFVDISSK